MARVLCALVALIAAMFSLQMEFIQGCRVKIPSCPPVVKVTWASSPPYVYRDPTSGQVTGMLPDILREMITHCCNSCVNITYNRQVQGEQDLLQAQGTRNSSDIAMPIVGEMMDTTLSGKPYVALIESPGIIHFIGNGKQRNSLASEIFYSTVSTWPVVLLIIMLAMISGVLVWALDCYFNPTQFPVSFFRGTWNGLWWAVVTMATVGYGDTCPKSLGARILAVVWLIVGLALVATFNARATATMLAYTMSVESISSANTVLALNESQEYRYGVQLGAKMKAVASIEEIQVQLNSDATSSALMESYMTGYNAPLLCTTGSPRLLSLLDHQKAYGILLNGAVETGLLKKCIIAYPSIYQMDVLRLVQKRVAKLPIPSISAAEQKSAQLFSPQSREFQLFMLVSCLFVLVTLVIGIAWEIRTWYKARTTEINARDAIKCRNLKGWTWDRLIDTQCREMEKLMEEEVKIFVSKVRRHAVEIKERKLTNLMTRGEEKSFDQVEKKTLGQSKMDYFAKISEAMKKSAL